jgi:hypothetical protein
MAEEYVNQAIEPLEQALVVAQQATKIPNFRTQDIGVVELCGLVCTSVPATANLML